MDCNKRIKVITDGKTLHANHLKNAMREAVKIDFGAGGYCSWASNENGVRTFNVKVKVV